MAEECPLLAGLMHNIRLQYSSVQFGFDVFGFLGFKVFLWHLLLLTFDWHVLDLWIIFWLSRRRLDHG